MTSSSELTALGEGRARWLSVINYPGDEINQKNRHAASTQVQVTTVYIYSSL